MRITQFTEFGLRLLMRLSWEPGRIFTTEAIADELGLSRNHLTKVAQSLRAAGYVVTLRGAGGGLRLARPAAEIDIGEVMRRMEGGSALVECFRADGGACALQPMCRLRKRLSEAREAFFAELDGTTLEQCSYPPVLRAPSRSDPSAAPPDAREL